MTTDRIARLKITLDHIDPPVMRRIEVPLAERLDSLHLIIQAAMGWTDFHLWAFDVRGASWGPPMDEDGFGPEMGNAAKATLLDVLEDTGAKTLRYTYDFGDCWDHTIKIERLLDADPEHAYPRLVAASGACPPEDIGGVPGYYDFLDALADPDHESHEVYVEWWGGTFDPQAVDIARIDAALAALAKRGTRKPRRRRPKPT